MLRYRVMKGWRSCRCRVSIMCSLHCCSLEGINKAEIIFSEKAGYVLRRGEREIWQIQKRRALVR